ncbi:hypothetical protein COB55_02825 [Candidatus Wolfebacteria bacterium]|nr:MAG: hypothetical protein COB55_02825 [Candidatus Wolfebacteria bacterium]
MEPEKQNKINRTLWRIVGVLILVCVFWYVFVPKLITPGTVVDDPNTVEISPGVSVNISNSDVSVDEISAPIPDVEFTPSVTKTEATDSEKDTLERIESLQKTLKKNPNIFQAWTELGSQYILLKEYSQAILVLEFAGEIRPTSAIPASNLAFMYGYYLHEEDNAVQNYLRAIELEPGSDFNYIRLFEFYRDTDQMEQARRIILGGLEINPDSETLQSYRDI